MSDDNRYRVVYPSPAELRMKKLLFQIREAYAELDTEQGPGYRHKGHGCFMSPEKSPFFGADHGQRWLGSNIGNGNRWIKPRKHNP